MASEYLKWKYRDVRPNEKVELTKEQKRRNWWYYHKWHVVIAVAAVLIAASLLWSALTQVRPDYQLAYVGTVPLSEEEQNAWISCLAALGVDCNGDGTVAVQLNPYLTSQDSGNATYNYAANVKLMADLESNESYFFLLEDPEGFQRDYEILREDWLPLESGLFLARRDFWEHRTPENMADCDRLWDELTKEMAP